MPNEEVIKLYGGTHIPLNIMDDHLHKTGLEEKSPNNMTQFLDTFAKSEAALFADISEVSVLFIWILKLNEALKYIKLLLSPEMHQKCRYPYKSKRKSICRIN